MTINQRFLGGAGARRQLQLAALCLLASIASGCKDHPKDVTSDPKYLNFSTVTGRWKTRQTLNLVQNGNLLYLWTTDRSVGGPDKLLATMPPGTEISVEHLTVHPSWEAGEIISRDGSLVSGPYASKTLDLDPYLFARNAINAGDQSVRKWEVDPNQLEK